MTISSRLASPKFGRNAGLLSPRLRKAVIVSIPIAAALSGYLLNMTSAIILIMVLLSIVGGLVLLGNQALALGLFIVVCLFDPVSIAVNLSTVNGPVLMMPVLVVLWLVDSIVIKREIKMNFGRPMLPLFGLGVVTVLAFLAGQLPWFPVANAPITAQLAGMAIILFSIAIFFLAANLAANDKVMQRLTWVFLSLGGSLMVLRLLPGWSRRFGGILGKVDSKSSMFVVWLVSIALGQVVANNKMRWYYKIALIGVIAAAMFRTLVQNSGWASGWLPTVIAIGIIMFMLWPKLGLPGAALGAILFVSQLSTVFNWFLVGGDNEYSLSSRLAAWSIVGEIAKINPILGLGPANYYWYTPLYSILGFFVQFNSHNQYIDMIAQTGILGLLFFFWFVWEMCRLTWKLYNRDLTGFQKGLLYGVFGGLGGSVAAGMLGDWFLPFVYNVGIRGFRASVLGWLFLGMLVALDVLTTEKKAKGIGGE